MKSFHLSGPKFDIAVEMFCMVEFSNFLLGQKFVAVEFENAKIGPKKANFVKGALCYVLPFFLGEFPQKMVRDIWSSLTNLEVSYDFPDTLKSTGGLY